MAAFITVMPAAGQTDEEVPTYLLLNVAPNPIGVGQSAFVNTFMTKPTPTANGFYGDHYMDITIKVVRPDGTEETLGPFEADSAAGTYTSYVPKETGEYKFQAFYPGQTLTGYNPTFPDTLGFPNLIGSELLPSESEIVTLVVQEESITGYESPPLPTEYWSRPIYSLNYEWAHVLGGNWLGLAGAGGGGFAVTGYYDATGNVQLYTTAPKTGHILWTKPTAFGGQVGGPIEPNQENLYHSTEPLTSYFEPIIINGILYYDQYSTYSIHPDSWVAVDLRTGEELWKKPCGITGNEKLRYGQVLTWHTIHVFGSSSYLWSIEGTSLPDTRPTPGGNLTLRLYDPMDCTYICEIIDARNLNMISDTEANEQGTLLGWYASDGNLTLWNSTRALAYPTGFTGTPQRTYRPKGSIPWSAGIEWSVPLPTELDGNPISLSVAAVTPEVVLMRQAPGLANLLMSPGYEITAGYDAKTGALLWGPLKQTMPQFQAIQLPANPDGGFGGVGDGVYTLLNKDTMEIYGYSLTNGQKIWGPVALKGNALSHLAVGSQVAYGNLYVWDFGGYVNALDLQTGEVLWTLTPRSTGYDTPYGTSPQWPFAGSICDGILFLGEGSLYNPPVHPNARMLAINCTTGELVWSILGYSCRHVAALADSMMVRWNSYDKQIYTFGKGQTATTVTASPKISVNGDKVLVEGMVTDESPGTKDSDRTARFPNGVPAVADDCMSPWMEYVYMQQPKPTNATGVKVTVTVLDPNGNCYDVGTATSDVNGFYKLTFIPEVPGEYTLFATFEGTESYWSSQAETAINVEEAPATTPEPTPEPASLADIYILPGIIGIIIAVVVIGLVIILMLRKR